MKNINNFIYERFAQTKKFLIKYKIKNKQTVEIFSDNWKLDIPKDAESFEVYYANADNLSEPDDLLAWKNSYYWLSKLKDNNLRERKRKEIESKQIK